MTSSQSRIRHLWYIFTWILLLALIIITYHFIDESRVFRLEPKTWTLVDNIYKTLRGLLVLSIIASIVSLIIREIKYNLVGDNLAMRKFLPTIRFFILLILWLTGGFFILESLQINTSKLLAGAGIGGAIFAFGLRDFIANIIGSLSIILSKAFDIGDTIRIKGMEGVVEEVTLNYTKIMNTEGKVIFIPNRTLTTEQLENLTRRRFFLYSFRVPFKKTIGDPQKIKDMLMMIEGKISEYAPIEIAIKTEIPNAVDFVYVFEVKIPDENEQFDREIREFLIPYIFPKE